jgi:hypothetical protein
MPHTQVALTQRHSDVQNKKPARSRFFIALRAVCYRSGTA